MAVHNIKRMKNDPCTIHAGRIKRNAQFKFLIMSNIKTGKITPNQLMAIVSANRQIIVQRWMLIEVLV